MKTLSLPQPVLYILYRLAHEGYESYIVGGAVRDILLGRETNDWDFTTNATPEQIQSVFPDNFYDNDFGTVGVAMEHILLSMKHHGWKLHEDYQTHASKQVFEITTFRSESGYSDRRRPDAVSWGESLEDDLSRRDFTINAMALSIADDPRLPELNGRLAYAQKSSSIEVTLTLVDPYDGMIDLEKRRIASVGAAHVRFDEDALRMMRAIRFGAQLGFVIQADTLQAISEKAELITHVSWERIRDELMKLLGSDYPADGIMLMHSSGILNHVLPELLEGIGIKQGGHHIYDVWTHSIESLRHCPSKDPLIRLATLLHDVGKPRTVRYQGPRGVTFYGHEVVGARMVDTIGKRLRLSKKQVDTLYTLVRWHMFHYDPEMTDSAIKRFIRRVGIERINDMMMLRIGDRKGGGSKATSWRLRELQQRIGENLYEPMSVKDLKINGHDLMQELGINPGREIGIILNHLFEEVMEDSSKNERGYLLERAGALYAQLNSSS